MCLKSGDLSSDVDFNGHVCVVDVNLSLFCSCPFTETL